MCSGSINGEVSGNGYREKRVVASSRVARERNERFRTRDSWKSLRGVSRILLISNVVFGYINIGCAKEKSDWNDKIDNHRLPIIKYYIQMYK